MEAPIVACVTPWGSGAISVVRLSGPQMGGILRVVCGKLPTARSVCLVKLRDERGVFDEGMLTWMPGPRSYTGEDVAEVSCHGNPLLVQRLLAAFVAAGARMARPGEFSRRAFLHGKMDLTQAEAVLQTLEATSEAGLAVARDALSGKVTAAAEPLRAGVVEVASELEAILDYPGEDLLFETDERLKERLWEQSRAARLLAGSFEEGRLALEGAKVVLLGSVNAGKSSLFNALLGRKRALVSDRPGTTRDVVESSLQLPEMRLLLLDTAGFRETPDPIEAEGVERSGEAASEADLRLLLFPLHHPPSSEFSALLQLPGPQLRIGTHLDLVSELPTLPFSYIPVSSHSKEGLSALKSAMVKALSKSEPQSQGLLLGSQRQRDLFLEFAENVDAAAEALSEAGPAVAAERLYAALSGLDALTGRDTREQVLDRLFQRFCVGK